MGEDSKLIFFCISWRNMNCSLLDYLSEIFVSPLRISTQMFLKLLSCNKKDSSAMVYDVP